MGDKQTRGLIQTQEPIIEMEADQEATILTTGEALGACLRKTMALEERMIPNKGLGRRPQWAGEKPIETLTQAQESIIEGKADQGAILTTGEASGACLGKTTALEERMIPNEGLGRRPQWAGEKPIETLTQAQEPIIEREVDQEATNLTTSEASGAFLGKTTAHEEKKSSGQSDGPTRTVGEPRSGCLQEDQRPCQSEGACPGKTTPPRLLSMARETDVEKIWKEAERRLGADRSNFSLVRSSHYLQTEGTLEQPEQIFEVRW
jgi:hypothetical protein